MDKTRDRFIFKVHHDVALLKACLQHNPWQLGQGQWTLVQKEMKKLGWTLSLRTIKLHVKLLRDKLKEETLTVK